MEQAGGLGDRWFRCGGGRPKGRRYADGTGGKSGHRPEARWSVRGRRKATEERAAELLTGQRAW